MVYLSAYQEYMKARVAQRIKEMEEEEEEEEEEIPEKIIYKSWIITFETRARPGYRGWVRTQVEVWAETVNVESRIPDDGLAKELLLNSIARNDQWSWILNMSMKFGVEEESETAIEALTGDVLKVIIYRTTDYRVEDQWEIQY